MNFSLAKIFANLCQEQSVGREFSMKYKEIVRLTNNECKLRRERRNPSLNAYFTNRFVDCELNKLFRELENNSNVSASLS